jgi:hypothetical protein
MKAFFIAYEKVAQAVRQIAAELSIVSEGQKKPKKTKAKKSNSR